MNQRQTVTSLRTWSMKLPLLWIFAVMLMGAGVPVHSQPVPPAPGGVLAPPPAAAATADGTPERPANFDFVADYAGLIQKPDLNRIGAAQKVAFETHGVPIIVVTIPSLKAYQFGGSIEQFAAKVFNQWRIGTQDKSGGANKGILLMVSVGDRKARIELGGDWGRAWDGNTDQIMGGRIIPKFKQGDYSGGIAAGVEALGLMAGKNSAGPAAAAASLASSPGASPVRGGPGTGSGTSGGQGMFQQLTDSFSSQSAGQSGSPASPIPKQGGMILMGLGVLVLIASFFMPEGLRKPLFWLGIILILLPLFFFVIMFAFAWLFGGKGGRSGGGGGGGWSGGSFSSGGGFSGGSSGGGGSTGSW